MEVTTNSERLAALPPHDPRAALRRAQPRLLGVRLQRPLRTADAGADAGHDARPLPVPVSASCPVDASHERFVVDHNRCILCTRCVRVCDEIEGAHTWDVMGARHRLPRDHGPEPSRGARRKAAPAAASACRSAPPARCRRKGRSVAEMSKRQAVPAVSDADAGGPTMSSRIELATVWLDGCSGCHMSLLDIDERLIELRARRGRGLGPAGGRKEFPEDVDVDAGGRRRFERGGPAPHPASCGRGRSCWSRWATAR